MNKAKSKKRIKSLKFHIDSNDYFASLATIIDLLQQNIKEGNLSEANYEIIEKIKGDLIYLQENYLIIKK